MLPILHFKPTLIFPSSPSLQKPTHHDDASRDKTIGPAPHHPAGSRPAARLTFHSPLPTAKEGGRKESASSVESVLTSPRGSDNYDTMVERNESFASHGGESSPNSNYSEFPLSGSQAFPFSINYPSELRMGSFHYDVSFLHAFLAPVNLLRRLALCLPTLPCLSFIIFFSCLPFTPAIPTTHL